jgi:hypothetical protein
METNGTKWLGRKAWRRLLELRGSGRISRQEFELLKERLARHRAPPGTEAPRPALRLVRGRDRPRLDYLLPAEKEVA